MSTQISAGTLLTVKGKQYTLEDVRAWKKEGNYLASPVDIFISEQGDIGHNAPELRAKVEGLGETIKSALPTMTVSDLEQEGKDIKLIKDWLTTTRTGYTKKFDEIKSEFTPIEKLLTGYANDISSQIDELKESGYKQVESLLSAFIQSAIDASGYSVSMESFSGFISKKRTNKGTTNAKDQLTPAVKKEAEALLDTFIQPLREAKESAERKDTQHATFTELLEHKDDVQSLALLKAQAGTMFPDIEEHVIRTIDQKISKLTLAKQVEKELPQETVEPVATAQPEAQVVTVDTGINDREKLANYAESIGKFAADNLPEFSGNEKAVAAWLLAEITKATEGVKESLAE